MLSRRSSSLLPTVRTPMASAFFPLAWECINHPVAKFIPGELHDRNANLNLAFSLEAHEGQHQPNA